MSVSGVSTTPSSAAFLQPASAALSRPARPPPSEVAKGRMRAALALMVALNVITDAASHRIFWLEGAKSQSEKPPGNVADGFCGELPAWIPVPFTLWDSDVTTILARRGASAIKSAILIRAISRIK